LSRKSLGLLRERLLREESQPARLSRRRGSKQCHRFSRLSVCQFSSSFINLVRLPERDPYEYDCCGCQEKAPERKPFRRDLCSGCESIAVVCRQCFQPAGRRQKFAEDCEEADSAPG